MLGELHRQTQGQLKVKLNKYKILMKCQKHFHIIFCHIFRLELLSWDYSLREWLVVLAPVWTVQKPFKISGPKIGYPISNKSGWQNIDFLHVGNIFLKRILMTWGNIWRQELKSWIFVLYFYNPYYVEQSLEVSCPCLFNYWFTAWNFSTW